MTKKARAILRCEVKVLRACLDDRGPSMRRVAPWSVEDALHAPGETYQGLTDSENRTEAQQSKAVTDFFTMLGMLSNLPLRPVGQAINVAQP